MSRDASSSRTASCRQRANYNENKHTPPLSLRHRCHSISNVNRKLTNVHKSMLVGSHSVHSIELCYTVAHHNKRLVRCLVILFATLHKGEINSLLRSTLLRQYNTFIAGSMRYEFCETSFLSVRNALICVFYRVIS